MAKSVKISNEMWDRIRRAAEAAGYSGPEELVLHILEKELARQEQQQDENAALERLRGLGYID